MGTLVLHAQCIHDYTRMNYGQTFGREVPKTASREALALDLTPRVAGGMAVVSMNSSGLPESFTELVGSVGQPPVAR